MKLFDGATPEELAALTAPYDGRALFAKLRALGWEVVAGDDTVTYLQKLGALHTSMDTEGERWVFSRHTQFGRGVMLARARDIAVLGAMVERVNGVFASVGGVEAFMQHLDRLPDLTPEQRAALDVVSRMGTRFALLEHLASLVEGEHDTKS